MSIEAIDNFCNVLEKDIGSGLVMVIKDTILARKGLEITYC